MQCSGFSGLLDFQLMPTLIFSGWYFSNPNLTLTLLSLVLTYLSIGLGTGQVTSSLPIFKDHVPSLSLSQLHFQGGWKVRQQKKDVGFLVGLVLENCSSFYWKGLRIGFRIVVEGRKVSCSEGLQRRQKVIKDGVGQ